MQLQSDNIGELLTATTEISNILYYEEYKIVHGHDLEAFQKLVNDYLIDEWKCLGGLSVVTQTDVGEIVPVFYQAIVK